MHKKNTIASMIGLLLLLGIFFVPAVVRAKPLIPCSGVVTGDAPDSDPISGISNKECGFNQLIELINNITDFILIDLATPIFVIGIIIAGGALLTSGGSSEAKSRAKGIFTKMIIGYVLVLLAWLIVKTIMVGLGYDTSVFKSFYQ